MPSHELNAKEILGAKLVDLFVKTQLQSSKGEALRLLQSGGMYLNNEKIVDRNRAITENDLIDGRLLLLAVGKKNKILIRVI